MKQNEGYNYTGAVDLHLLLYPATAETTWLRPRLLYEPGVSPPSSESLVQLTVHHLSLAGRNTYPPLGGKYIASISTVGSIKCNIEMPVHV